MSRKNAGRPKIVQSVCDLQLPQLASRDGRDVHEPLDLLALRKGSFTRALLNRPKAPSLLWRFLADTRILQFNAPKELYE